MCIKFYLLEGIEIKAISEINHAKGLVQVARHLEITGKIGIHSCHPDFELSGVFFRLLQPVTPSSNRGSSLTPEHLPNLQPVQEGWMIDTPMLYYLIELSLPSF